MKPTHFLPSIVPLIIATGTLMLLGTTSGQSQTPSLHENSRVQPLPQFRQQAQASVRVNGKTITLEPNTLGIFPRVYVQPSDSIAVKVAYQDANPAEGVDVQVEDGGQIIESKSVGHHGKLNESGVIAFTFKVTDQLGIYRVILRKGEDVKQLEFWVGDAQPLGNAVTKIPQFKSQR